MSKKDTGGPAFPALARWDDGRMEYVVVGMDLLDYFAAKAMQAIISGQPDFDDEALIAKAAYMTAKAMLLERNKK